MCFGSLLKRRKSQNQKTEDYEDDVFVMELKDTSKDLRPANFTASQSADRLISEVKASFLFRYLLTLVFSCFKLTRYV